MIEDEKRTGNKMFTPKNKLSKSLLLVSWNAFDVLRQIKQ